MFNVMYKNKKVDSFTSYAKAHSFVFALYVQDKKDKCFEKGCYLIKEVA